MGARPALGTAPCPGDSTLCAPVAVVRAHTSGGAGREAAGAVLLGVLPQELEPVTQAVAQVGQVLPSAWLWEIQRGWHQVRQS